MEIMENAGCSKDLRTEVRKEFWFCYDDLLEREADSGLDKN